MYAISVVVDSREEEEIRAVMGARGMVAHFMPASHGQVEVLIERDERVDAVLARGFMPEPRHPAFVSAAVSHVLLNELNSRSGAKALVKALKRGLAKAYGAEKVYNRILEQDMEYAQLDAGLLAAA